MTRERDAAWRDSLPWIGATMLLFVAVGFLLYGSTGRDDVHITYWAAHTLAEFGEILNYNGVRLEQSSTLFHTVLLAAVRTLVPVRMATLGPVTSILGGAVTIGVVYALARRLQLDRPGVPAMFCALLAYLAYWSFSGMETSWAAALTAGTVWAAHRWISRPTALRWTVFVVVLLAFVSVRPEAGMVALSGFIGYAVLTGVRESRPSRDGGLLRSVKRPLTLAATAVITFTGLAWARMQYFGKIFPAPVSAKVSGVDHFSLMAGWGYLLDSILTPSLVFLAGMGIVAVWEGRDDNDAQVRLRFLIIGFVAAIAAFCVTTGGDWMEGGRFLVPALPLVALLGAEGVLRIGRRRWIIVGVALILLLADALMFGRRDSTGDPAPFAHQTYGPILAKTDVETSFSWWEKANRVHVRDIPTLAWLDHLMQEVPASEKPLTVWSGQAGMIFYHLARTYPDAVQFVDVRGLSTRHLQDCGLKGVRAGTRIGVVISYAELLRLAPTALRRCELSRPDLIVDIDPKRHIQQAVDHGYRIVYRQIGSIEPALNGWGREVTTAISGGFVAVREGLAREVPETEVFFYP